MGKKVITLISGLITTTVGAPLESEQGVIQGCLYQKVNVEGL